MEGLLHEWTHCSTFPRPWGSFLSCMACARNISPCGDECVCAVHHGCSGGLRSSEPAACRSCFHVGKVSVGAVTATHEHSGFGQIRKKKKKKKKTQKKISFYRRVVWSRSRFCLIKKHTQVFFKLITKWSRCCRSGNVLLTPSLHNLFIPRSSCFLERINATSSALCMKITPWSKRSEIDPVFVTAAILNITGMNTFRWRNSISQKESFWGNQRRGFCFGKWCTLHGAVFNQRSCKWIIPTNEPCLAAICIYWLPEVSLHSPYLGWITTYDVISTEIETSKKAPLSWNLFFFFFHTLAWIQFDVDSV